MAVHTVNKVIAYAYTVSFIYYEIIVIINAIPIHHAQQYSVSHDFATYFT